MLNNNLNFLKLAGHLFMSCIVDMNCTTTKTRGSSSDSSTAKNRNNITFHAYCVRMWACLIKLE